MKNYILIILMLCLISGIDAQSYINKKGDRHLWGPTTIEEFSSGPYEEWYIKYSKDYKTEISNEDAKYLDDIEVKIYVGTWCGDTKFLVPKFIETWKQLKLDPNQLEIIALHNEGSSYKQGPNGETIGQNIHRVPTFVFSKNEKEIGRIVERTIHDLDDDILLIAKELPYKERYQGEALLSNYFKEYEGDSLLSQTSFKTAIKLVGRELSSSSDLNTYGYVLMAQNEMEKAEFTFRLNRFLYPYNANAIDSYGEFLYKNDRFEDALKQYHEVLRIKGSDKNATRMIAKIYEKQDELKAKTE